MKNHRYLRVCATAALATLLASASHAQTIYKCPAANGRVALQDLPCQGGEQRQIKPASGSDQKSAPPDKSVAKNDLDRLRESVGKDASARKFKDADYDVSVFGQRINNFPIYRAKILKERATFYNCGSTKHPVMCEDMENYRAVDAELSVQLNQLHDLRSNAQTLKRAASKEHLALTGKSLDP